MEIEHANWDRCLAEGHLRRQLFIRTDANLFTILAVPATRSNDALRLVQSRLCGVCTEPRRPAYMCPVCYRLGSAAGGAGGRGLSRLRAAGFSRRGPSWGRNR